MKAVVIISGGCLQAVYSDNPDLEVTLLDFDNAEDEGKTEEMEVDEEEAKETMKEVWP